MSYLKEFTHGVTHEGTPEGKIRTVYGVRVYVATPTVDYPKDKAILILPDIYGLDLIHTQLLADDFARNGFLTIIPDYFNNDPAPPDGLTPGSKFDLEMWFMTHGNEDTRPSLDKVLRWIVDYEGITVLGSTGYGFGARYAFNLAFESITKATVVSHPALLNIPGDLETYHVLSTAPLLINSCTYDRQFTLESQKLSDEYLKGRYRPGYKQNHYEGVYHGFAIRPNLADPKAKAAKEDSFKATVEWFMKYL